MRRKLLELLYLWAALAILPDSKGKRYTLNRKGYSLPLRIHTCGNRKLFGLLYDDINRKPSVPILVKRRYIWGQLESRLCLP
ncbi:hypothetical protein F4825DRAFT_445726 [Nemania diffusa]|nr:hypothetical protein F4825DRAFT_445726 [Nemania diffusa]